MPEVDSPAPGGQLRNNIAAIDAATGSATFWNPNANGGVYALALSGGIIYAGGLFHIIGGQPRNYLAGIDASTGLATPWNPNPNGGIGLLAISGGIVYVGGGIHQLLRPA